MTSDGGPGWHRYKRWRGAEALRLDTLRLQKEALRDAQEHSAGRDRERRAEDYPPPVPRGVRRVGRG